MVCPFCLAKNTLVYNSRQNARSAKVWRRRRCKVCNEAFTTYEKIDLGILEIIKKNGKCEPYLRAKLFASIFTACEGLPDQAMTVEALTDTVEVRLLNLKRLEASSQKVAEEVLETLKRFNTAAFVRYLSYRTELISDKQLKDELKRF